MTRGAIYIRIEVQIDESCREPRVIVLTDRMSDEVNALVRRLSDESPRLLPGFRGETLEPIEPGEIVRVYAANGKVYAATERGEYLLRLRLYEAEERLDKATFARISNAEIINLKKARAFDLSLSGTICVRLTDNTITYVSRRYVAKIKQILGI